MKINPLFRFPSTEHWITALLFLCLLLLAWVKTAYPQKISLVFRDTFTATLPEEDNGINPASIALFFIFICSVVLLVMQLMNSYGIKLGANALSEFASIALFLFLYYAAKTIVIMITGFVFEEQARAWEYVSEIYVFAHFLGLVLLPAALVVTYASITGQKVVLEAIFAGIVLLLVYRTIKMFILMTNKGLSMMYLFLYICALEILPVALFYKYAKMSLNI
jgi:hypothetical protein